MVWWIASGADDEQYRGKNGLTRGVLELVKRVLLGPDLSLSFSSLFLSPLFLASLFLWCLVLFVEALVLFPNNEWEGRQHLPF